MIYTAAQVRELAARLHDSLCEVESYHDEADALTAYAERLEQDEQTLKEGDVFTIENVYVVNPEFSERELGRREVYRKIAEIDPIADMGGSWYCVMCGVDHHTHDCLWLEAHAALRETTPTP